jgi:hypothetical protein
VAGSQKPFSFWNHERHETLEKSVACVCVTSKRFFECVVSFVVMQCSLRRRRQPPISSRIDEEFQRVGRYFVQRWAICKHLSRQSETATVAISLREMCLVGCTLCFQSRRPISSRIDEEFQRVVRYFVQRWAVCKDSSRRSETATVAISLREMCLVGCTLWFPSRRPISSRIDEEFQRVVRSFVQRWVVCKNSSRRSETATVAISLREMSLLQYRFTPTSSVVPADVLEQDNSQRGRRRDSRGTGRCILCRNRSDAPESICESSK